MTRPTYVYRLVVIYPSGIGWLNPPAAWVPHDDEDEFLWPRTRLYLARSSAMRRKALLESYGAQVTVVRSERVVWPA